MSVAMLLGAPKDEEPLGQVLFTSLSPDFDFTVPDGVVSICCVCIGPGRGYGGGGLSWRNHIPVTPGETLTIILDGTSELRRGSEILTIAKGSLSGSLSPGLGGKAAGSMNDGGGNGGSSQNNGGRGGAGGYTGNGGSGYEYSDGSNGTGGGGGGGSRNRGFGGGTHPFGRGVNGIGGTSNTGNGGRGSYLDGRTRSPTYGGGIASNSAIGCVRIIWGTNRFFPDTRTEDL